MPRYRLVATGVVVDIPEDTAARIDGLEPLDPPPVRRRTRKTATKPEQ